METIKLDSKLDGIVIKRSFTLSRNKIEAKAKLGITIHAALDYTGITVQEILTDKCAPHDAIVWQHRARPVFDLYKNGQKVNILVTDLAKRSTIDPATTQRNRYVAADTLEQKALVLHESTDIPLKDCRDIVEARMAS